MQRTALPALLVRSHSIVAGVTGDVAGDVTCRTSAMGRSPIRRSSKYGSYGPLYGPVFTLVWIFSQQCFNRLFSLFHFFQYNQVSSLYRYKRKRLPTRYRYFPHRQMIDLECVFAPFFRPPWRIAVSADRGNSAYRTTCPPVIHSLFCRFAALVEFSV